MRRRTALRSLAGAAAGALSIPVASLGSPSAGEPAATAGRPASREGYAPLGRLELGGAAEAVVDDAGETAYVATLDGFAAVDIRDPTSPRKLTHRTVMADFEDGPLGDVADCSLDGDRLLVGGPYGGGRFRGLALFDVSDPANTDRLLARETGFAHHNLKLQEEMAYLTRPSRYGSELVLADLSGGTYEERGTWTLLDHDEGWAEVDNAATFVHDLWPHGDRVYLACWDAGTFVVDVSDPDAPETVAKVGGHDLSNLQRWDVDVVGTRFLEPPGNHHFATVNEDASLLAIGRESWDDPNDTPENGGPGGVELWDISDPTAATRYTIVEAPPSPDPTVSFPDTTAHNLDVHGDRLFTSWYHGGVRLFDISDPAAPELLAWWRRPDTACFWTARRATAECFVATSTGLAGRQTDDALYTFPNRPGEQADPPGVFTETPTATPSPDTGTSTGTPSPGAGTPTVTSTAADPTGDRTPTGTTSPTRTPSPGPESKSAAASPSESGPPNTPSETPTTVPGFGLAAAVGGAALAAWRRARR